MQTNLYNLPKDLLVKLIMTIREDTIEEFNDKLNKRLENEEINAMFCAKCTKQYSTLYKWRGRYDPYCKECDEDKKNVFNSPCRALFKKDE